MRDDPRDLMEAGLRSAGSLILAGFGGYCW